MSKIDNVFFYFKLFLLLSVICVSIYTILINILTINIDKNFLTFSHGLAKTNKIYFNTIIEIKLIKEPKTFSFPNLNNRPSKNGVYLLTYKGKTKFKKHKLIIDLDLFENHKELKSNLIEINPYSE